MVCRIGPRRFATLPPSEPGRPPRAGSRPSPPSDPPPLARTPSVLRDPPPPLLQAVTRAEPCSIAAPGNLSHSMEIYPRSGNSIRSHDPRASERVCLEFPPTWSTRAWKSPPTPLIGIPRGKRMQHGLCCVLCCCVLCRVVPGV